MTTMTDAEPPTPVKEKEKGKEGFASALPEAAQRAMSKWLHNAFLGGIRSKTDFIDHFGVEHVITHLSPEVRGKVLCACNGGGDIAKASKIKPERVAALIASMLEQGLVTADDICADISTDHMVEKFPNDELYALLYGYADEPSWVQQEPDNLMKKAFLASADAAIRAEGLLPADVYVKTMGEEAILNANTPNDLLASLVQKALEMGRKGQPFTDEHLRAVCTSERLIDYNTTPTLFRPCEAVAKANDWSKPRPKPPAPPPATPKADEKTPESPGSAITAEAPAADAPAQAGGAPPDAPEVTQGEEVDVHDLNTIPPPPDKNADPSAPHGDDAAVEEAFKGIQRPTGTTEDSVMRRMQLQDGGTITVRENPDKTPPGGRSLPAGMPPLPVAPASTDPGVGGPGASVPRPRKAKDERKPGNG